jgi:hypothetical protein
MEGCWAFSLPCPVRSEVVDEAGLKCSAGEPVVGNCRCILLELEISKGERMYVTEYLRRKMKNLQMLGTIISLVLFCSSCNVVL